MGEVATNKKQNQTNKFMREYIRDGRAVTALFIIFTIGLIATFTYDLFVTNIRLERENRELYKAIDTLTVYMHYTDEW